MSDINIQTFSGKVQVNNNLKVGQGHLFVDTAQNQVGLNTTNPLANLHVNGNTYVHSDLRVGSGIVMDQKVATFGATKTFVVEVVGGVFQIDGVSRPALTFHENQTYIFDQSHVSNSGHPIAFSEAVNGGTPYSTGVTSVGAKTTFKVSVGAPSNLFYYCVNHPSTMGSLAGTPSVVSTEAEIIVSGRLLATSIHGDGSALVNIPSSAINGTLSQWTDVNANEIYYDLGNVGIGNQNPNSTLDVTGTGSFSGDLTVGTDKFFVDVSTGQVGVGTTTPAAGKALDVIGDLRATYLYGDGSNINNITSSQWVTTGNDIYYDTGSVRVGSSQPPAYTLDVLGDINFTGDIRKGGVVQTFGGGAAGGGTWTEISGTTQIHYSTGNVGIANTNPQHTLSVGSNLYVEDAGSNVLVVDGNVACNQVTLGQFEIVPSYGLNDVTAESNVTTDTVELNNVTTGLSTVSNVAVGGELAVSSNLTVSGNVVVSKDLTVTENVVVSKDLTVTEELVASANVEVGNNLTVTGVSVIPGYAKNMSATGGTESSFASGSENYKLHTFTSDGTFTVTGSGIVDYLIVGGGGGGGCGESSGGGHAGGGGGGVITGTIRIPVGVYTVTVGDGGNGGLYNSNPGSNGENSTFIDETAFGGGGGEGTGAATRGRTGASGGGGGGDQLNLGKGYGMSPQGTDGVDGSFISNYNPNQHLHRGGGGGGAGLTPTAPVMPAAPNLCPGRDGRPCSITGSQVYYGGGGGGGGISGGYTTQLSTGGAGGLGGGGTSGISISNSNKTAGSPGTPNTGGGGGGGGYAKDGGSGGSGIVIIRYLM